MLSINTNLSSLIVQGNLDQSTNKLNQAIERMTTGYKINHASDNAANYSIATNMDTKSGAYMVAEENASMGLDMLMTAEDSLSQINTSLERLRSLAVTAQNGTYGAKSLDAVNSEADALASEINRIFKTATYNGKKLLDAYHTEIPEDVGCQVDLTPKYNGFIEDPVDYTDAEIALMNKMSEVDVDNDTISSGQYSISTAEDLAKLATMTNDGRVTGGEFVLVNDIDMAPYLSSHTWVSIGTWSYVPNIIFNGNGHVVKNFSGNKALFFIIKGEVKNIGMKNFAMTNCVPFVEQLYADMYNCYGIGVVSAMNTDNVSLLIGHSRLSWDNNPMKNCYVKGTINTENCRAVGGLTALNYRTNFENCFADIEIFDTNHRNGEWSASIGAICAGTDYSISSMKNCYTTGTIVSDADYVGGLAGSGVQHSIENCHSTMNITGKNYVGGLFATNGEVDIKNCYFSGNISGETFIGGIIGKVNKTNTTKLIDKVFFTGNISGLDIESTGAIIGGIIAVKDGSISKMIETTNCKVSTNNISAIGGAYDETSSVCTKINDYNLSSYLAGISTIYIPPDETTLQVGIKSADSSSLVFNATVEYGAFDVLQGLNLQDASAISTIDTLMKQVSDKQTELGATQNRLMSVLEEINVQYENLVSSRSTIQDADMSEVSATYIQQQILQQASATLMATANQTPAIALQLI